MALGKSQNVETQNCTYSMVLIKHTIFFSTVKVLKRTLLYNMPSNSTGKNVYFFYL